MYNRRSNRKRLKAMRNRTTVFTGGLNQRVGNLELNPGELYQVSNYMELSGRYHGYTSVPGYERFDGQDAPSSKSKILYADQGNDTNTTVLIESTNGVNPVDLSSYSQTVSTTGTLTFDTINYKYSDASYILGSILTPKTIRITDDGNLGFDVSKTIDIEFFTTNSTFPHVIASSENTWKLEVSITSKVIFTWYENGVAQSITSSSGIGANSWISCRVVYSGDGEFRLFVDGNLEATSSGAGTPDKGGLFVQLGSSTIVGTRVDTFRMSKGILAGDHDYTQPTVAYSTEGYFQVYWDDSLVEEQRDLITAVTTTGTPCTGNVLATHVYPTAAADGLTKVVSLRKTTGAATIEVHDQSASGWVNLGTINADPSSASINMCHGMFSEPDDNTIFGVVAGTYANKELMFLVVSSDATNAFYVYDGDGTNYGAVTIASISGANGICPAVAPKDCYVHDNRLFLVYDDGEVYHSGIGDPLRWDGSTDNASFHDFPTEVVSIQHIQDNTLAVFQERGINLLKGAYVGKDGTGTGWIWDNHVFNETVDVIANTVQRFGDTIYFVSKQGLNTLTKTEKYGDFEQGTLSHKVNETLLSNLTSITGSSINKDYGQYRVYFNTTALYFTLNEDGSVKGATSIDFEQQDDNTETLQHVAYSYRLDRTFFGSSDGFVYELDSGTSWDGESINTVFKSAFDPYGSPRDWKELYSVLFEMDAPVFHMITAKIRYSYDRSDLPKGESIVKFVKDQGGRWANSNTTWGGFIWGGSIISNPMFYFMGMGVNFSIEISTSSRNFATHTVNNAISDFKLMGRQI